MIKAIKDLGFKGNGYEVKPITQEQAEDLEIGIQIYAKTRGIWYPAKITKCFEGANKFEISHM